MPFDPLAFLSQHRLRWPAASLRAYLVGITIIASVPLAAFAFFLLERQAVAARADADEAVQLVARSFSLLVERELASSVDVLTGLAYNDALERGDTATFHRQLQRSAPVRPGWRGVYLAAPDGRVVFMTDQPYGKELGRLRDAGALERIRATLRPAATDLVAVSASGELVTGVQVPVLRDGRLAYVLGARIAASHWQQLVERASVPAGGLLSVLDRDSRVIAHNLDPHNLVGRVLPLDRQLHAIAESSSNWRSLPLLASEPFVARDVVPFTGWIVAAAVPSAPLIGAQTGVLASVLAVGALSLLLGIVLALTVARRVSVPLRQLALGGVAAVDEPVVVREIAALRSALHSAGELQQAARAELQRKADEFEALFSSSPIGLAMTLGVAGTQALINPALAAMLGTRAGLHELAPLLDAAGGLRMQRAGAALALAEQPLQRAARDGIRIDDDQLELVHADGRRIDLEVLAVPLRDAAGAPRGAVGAFVDITSRRLLEQQRARLMQAESQARQAAEQANRGKDAFLALLGHELRNPLGAIASAVEVLNRTQGQGDVAAHARRVIERQVRQMAQLMNDLQDVARAAAGKIALEPRRLDLEELVWRPLDALRVARRLEHHALTFDLQPAWVDADPVRIEQVVVNLVGNAAKYTPAGGSIEIVVRADDAAARLEVHDDGLGIAPELLPQVFDLFVQGDGTAGRRQGGMGLGLSLVKRLVELHGGTVQAASEGPNRGSRFVVRLPSASPPDDAPPREAAVWRGRRVLVVTPSDGTPFATESALSRAGCIVTATADGAIALDRGAALRFDVVLIDLALAGADALLHGLRAAGCRSPIVALADDERAPHAGFDAVVGRPPDLERLRQRLDRNGALAA
jgi:signal transduction histidine kinase